MSSADAAVILCPGQGAQTVGMGRAWCEASEAARRTFDEADAVLRESLGANLSEICFNGPAERLNRTDVSQPAIYVCSVACWRGMAERDGAMPGPRGLAAAAGLSLGEYTALHLAGAFDFIEGVRLVARRGRLMQEAAEASDGGMVALIGADEQQAEAVCREAARDDVLVCANFNAPGQVVLSGSRPACERAVSAASGLGLRATPLTVAGAFHSPLMQPAADRMAEALAEAPLRPLKTPVWANVTAQPHVRDDPELLRRRLVEQIISPVRWSQTMAGLVSQERHVSQEDCGLESPYHELAPGTVLRGLMRRIDRQAKVMTHDIP